MLRLDLTRLVQASVDRLVASGRLPSGLPPVELQDTKDPAHGDFATNFAMVAAKVAGMNPRELAEMVAEELRSDDVRIGSGLGSVRTPNPNQTLTEPHPNALSSVDLAGPGFINLRLNPEYVATYVPAILSLDPAQFAARAAEATVEKHRINVEFVSVNPNGPITVGSGRGAAFGSTLASVLEAAGHTVHREYYINDGVNSEQMRLFAESVRAAALGHEPPENGYKGDYVGRVGELLSLQWLRTASSNAKHARWLAESARAGDPQVLAQGFNAVHEQSIADIWQAVADKYEVQDCDATRTIGSLTAAEIQQVATIAMTGAQDTDLRDFGVEFDRWFSEQSLHDAGVVEKEIAALVAKGAADDRPIRHKLKLAKGGVIEDVEVEEQATEEDPESPSPPEGEKGWDEGRPATDSLSPSPPNPLSPARGEGEPEPHPPVGTLWLRSTKFGDDMDRVIRRKDGRLTYIASDVAYHKDKFKRPANADKLITVLGPDHHGYIGRLHAVLAAVEMRSEGSSDAVRMKLGAESQTEPHPNSNRTSAEPLSPTESKLYATPEERDACLAALEKARRELDVVIFQLVRFVKDGKPAPMRKRDGNIYALIDLIDEIGKKVKPEAPIEEQRKSGKDVARFFYLMRSHDTTFDFDLDLAEKQSDDNPVFYVQYAHARICSVLRKAEGSGLQSATANCQLLTHTKETALIKKILDLPHEVSRCAEDYGVHRLTTYAIELARTYHHFYDACRVIQPEEPELSQARLALCEVTKTALRATLDLLGIDAPESM